MPIDSHTTPCTAGSEPGPITTTAAVRPAQARTSLRWAFLDNLRVALTVLVVAHHVALAYGNLGFWPNWQQPPTAISGLAMDLFVLLNQSYFMGFFFLLSGLLVPGSADRRGVVGFARERLRRLGIPLVAALIVVRPLYTLPTYLNQPAAEREPYWMFFLTNWNIGPLWFLEVLLVLSLVYALLRRVRQRGPEVTSSRLRGRHVLLFAVVLGVAFYLWRIVFPVGTILLGIPSAAHLPQYVALFAVGVLAFRRGWLTALPHRAGLLGVSLLIASLLPMTFLSGVEALLSDPAPPPASMPQFGLALWEALFGVGAILVLTVIFQRHVTVDGPVAQWLARNAFAVYLVHAPIVVAVVALLHPLDLKPVVAFMIALPFSVVASWALAGLLRHVPAVRSVI